MPISVNPIAPISFPNSNAGQVAGRNVEIVGVTQDQPVTVSGSVAVSANGETVNTPFSVEFQPGDDVPPTVTATADTGAPIAVTVSAPTYVQGTSPYWNAVLEVTTV